MTPKLSPLSILNRKSQAAVLRFLWKSRSEWGGREIARQTGISAPSCHQALKQLDATGLVLFRRVANAHLYRINSENYLVDKVFTPLFEAEAAMPAQLIETIREFLTKGPGSGELLCAAVFGSMAAGREKLDSDMDLLLVTTTAAAAAALETRMQDLRKLVYKKFSIPVSPYIQPLADIRAKHKKKLPLVNRILEENKLICGKTLQELLA
jgi:predicted nucleotidyltransferase